MAVGPHELLKLVEKIYHDQGWTESVHVCDKPVFHVLSSVDLDPWRQKLSAVPSGTEECLEKEEEEDGVGSGAEMEDDGLREEEEEVADNELSEGEEGDCCWAFLRFFPLVLSFSRSCFVAKSGESQGRSVDYRHGGYVTKPYYTSNILWLMFIWRTI